MTPHQLAKRGAEHVLVGMDVDRAAVADLVVGTSVHVDPGWALAAEQQTLGSDVQDQQVSAVAEAQPRSAEGATDGSRAPGAQPLVAAHISERVVQPAAVGKVRDREACLVEAGLLGIVDGEVTELALVHGEGGVVERFGFDGG